MLPKANEVSSDRVQEGRIVGIENYKLESSIIMNRGGVEVTAGISKEKLETSSGIGGFRGS